MRRFVGTLGFGIAIVFVAALLDVRSAFGTESRSYAVSWFAPAIDNSDGDCSDGLNVSWQQQKLKDLAALGYSQKQIDEWVDKHETRKMDEIIAHRGRLNGQPVDPMTYPATVVDPKLHYLTGKYAYGFNLDGRGAASPDSFEDPETHELGVNNQLYRVLGCIPVFRGTLATPSTYFAYMYHQVKFSQPAWLITITGENLHTDGDVTITFDRALAHMRFNTNGTGRAYETYRIDPDPRSHNVFHGQLRGGVVTLTEPGTEGIHLFENPFILHEFRMDKVHMRLRMMGNGQLQCMIGGYEPWGDLWWSFSNDGESNEPEVINQDLVGIYYLFRKFADAEPDPKTGNNTAISATYYIEAVPAFVVPPTAVAKVTVANRHNSSVR